MLRVLKETRKLAAHGGVLTIDFSCDAAGITRDRTARSGIAVGANAGANAAARDTDATVFTWVGLCAARTTRLMAHHEQTNGDEDGGQDDNDDHDANKSKQPWWQPAASARLFWCSLLLISICSRWFIGVYLMQCGPSEEERPRRVTAFGGRSRRGKRGQNALD